VFVDNDTTATGDFEAYMDVTVGSGQNMNGTWTLTFTPVALGPANGRVDLWRFYTSSASVGASFVTGASNDVLVTEPGNTDSLITVGAYITRVSWTGCNGTGATYSNMPGPGNLAPFSSPGPTRDGREKPDITAPGVGIASTTSFDIARSCPSTGNVTSLLPDGLNHFINAGTSMAAPHVSGAVALILQNFGAVSPSWVKRFLFDHSAVDAMTGAVWNADWGHGKLHLDSSTPTLLSMFTAEPTSVGVELRWQLSEPERYSVIGVERADRAEGPWIALDAERSEEAGVTIVEDRSAAPGRAYLYRLRAQTRTGETLFFGPLSATAGVPIASFGLTRVSPNPTSGNTRIEFSLPHEAPIRLSVLDLQGREVTRLAEGTKGGGNYQVTWNGTLDDHFAAPGLYFIRLQTPVGSIVRRVAVTR
jgi:subtilisin family serine protease